MAGFLGVVEKFGATGQCCIARSVLEAMLVTLKDCSQHQSQDPQQLLLEVSYQHA